MEFELKTTFVFSKEKVTFCVLPSSQIIILSERDKAENIYILKYDFIKINSVFLFLKWQ